jgi:hypothetical protein
LKNPPFGIAIAAGLVQSRCWVSDIAASFPFYGLEDIEICVIAANFGLRYAAMTDRKSTKPFLRPLLLVPTTNAFDECSTVCWDGASFSSGLPGFQHLPSC